MEVFKIKMITQEINRKLNVAVQSHIRVPYHEFADRVSALAFGRFPNVRCVTARGN